MEVDTPFVVGVCSDDMLMSPANARRNGMNLKGTGQVASADTEAQCERPVIHESIPPSPLPNSE